MASYARSWDRFEAAAVQVVAISVDSVEQQRAMVDKLLLPFPLLSDPEGEVIKAWGVWNENEGGIARPALFLVQSDGSIGFSYVGADFADRPSDGELFGAVSGPAV